MALPEQQMADSTVDVDEPLLAYLAGQQPFIPDEQPMEPELEQLQAISSECGEQAEAGNDANAALWTQAQMLSIIAGQLHRIFLQLRGQPTHDNNP